MNRKTFMLHLTGFVAIGSKAKVVVPTAGKHSFPPCHIDPTLLHWMSLPRIPVLELEDEKVSWLVSRVLHRQPIEFIYQGGSEPGKRRLVSPGLMFKPEGLGLAYVQGYCHLRGEERIFRVDRMLSTDTAI